MAIMINITGSQGIFTLSTPKSPNNHKIAKANRMVANVGKSLFLAIMPPQEQQTYYHI